MMDLNSFDKVDIHDDELIATIMSYLKYADREHAARDDAISFLEFMRTAAKEIAARISIENFDEYYRAFKKDKA